jgi:hypothetical protein
VTRTWTVRIGIPAVLILIVGGCRTSIPQGQLRFSIVAPEKVNRGEEFSFSVTVTDASGMEVPKAVYHWFVDWEGVEGLRHKGKSGHSQHLRVKGSPGAAVLHIVGFDQDGLQKELARHEFVVE